MPYNFASSIHALNIFQDVPVKQEKDSSKDNRYQKNN